MIYSCEFKLRGVDMYSNIVHADADDVAINAANFLDSNFRGFIKNNYDSNSDGILSLNERNGATYMYL